MKLSFNKIFIVTAPFFIILAFSTCNLKSKKHNDSAGISADSLKLPEQILRYGLTVDSFIIKDGTVKRDQHLSHILSEYGVDMGTIDRIAKNSTPVFDVRKIKSGQNYTVFQDQDSSNTARYFVYENSTTDYFVFELFDSLRVYKGGKEVTSRLRTARGVIESSLWNTMIENDLDPMLAIRLNDIYAWTIDFFAIRKGDRFRIIYDELYVDSASIGIGEIYAVQFDHYGQENYAFRFFQDERFDYFDDKGVSLRKAFLKAPLKLYRISSRFSYSRMHPILRIRRPHLGVDYAAPKGTPVMSIGDGTVLERAYQKGGGGNYVKIKHNSVYTTIYMHLSGFGQRITSGTRVKQGQIIGYVGSTGLSTGPHLDFRVYKNGQPFDPLKVEAPPVEPVKTENIPEFTMLKDSLMAELQKIGWEDEIIAGFE